jgi:Spy/CpxP family protein refolding chaperone
MQGTTTHALEAAGGNDMKRIMVALGMVAAVTLTAATVFAWGPGMGRGMGPGMGHGFGQGYGAAAAVPNLSADQAAKIQKIRSDRYAEAQTVRGEMYAKKVELQALFREPVLDQAKITAKQKEITALQNQLQEKRLAARTAVAETLTPEPRAQLPADGPGVGGGRGRGMRFGHRW